MMILPSLGIGFPVVKESALAPSAPATKVAGATVGVTPLKMEGVKVTSAGRAPPEAAASSILVVPSFKVVIKATQAPLAPSNFWFVTEGMLSTTATAALVTAPSPCLVMVTVLPLLEAAKVPSMPLVMVAAVAWE